MIKNIFILMIGLLFIVGCENVDITTEVQAPIANNDSAEVVQDESIVILILGNDTDDHGIDKNSVRIIKKPAHGTVSLKDGGIVQFTADVNFKGTDTFTYTVKDHSGNVSNIATVTIKIIEKERIVEIKNKLPIANDDEVDIKSEQKVLINILENDKDEDGTIDKSSVVLHTNVNHGKIQIQSDGVVEFTADDYVGLVTFQYQVKDNKKALSNIASVNINITASTESKPNENKAPVAIDDNVTLQGKNTLKINVFNNDRDSDGNIVVSSIEIVSTVSHGSLSLDQDSGIITYISDNMYTGIETFTYRIKDNHGIYSNIATVDIDIISLELNKSKGVEKKAKEWYMRIVVEDTTNNMKTDSTQLGQLDGTDIVKKYALKAIAPFSRASYLDVVFKDPIGLDAGEYKSNLHESTTAEDSWEFTVKSHDDNATMILSWRGLYVLTPYVDTEERKQYEEYRSLSNTLLSYMSIVDIVEDKEFNIIEKGEVQTYVFHMNGSNERTFRWKIKESSVASKKKLSRTLSKYDTKMKKLQVKVLRKDAKATLTKLKIQRVKSLDMMTPPTFEVLVK